MSLEGEVVEDVTTDDDDASSKPKVEERVPVNESELPVTVLVTLVEFET